MGKKSLSGATDLLGDCIPTKRTNDRPEAAALCEVLMAHPAVVWCERMNSGAARPDELSILTTLNSAHAPPSLPNDLGDLKKMEHGQTHYKPNARAGHSETKKATYAGCFIRLAMDWQQAGKPQSHGLCRRCDPDLSASRARRKLEELGIPRPVDPDCLQLWWLANLVAMSALWSPCSCAVWGQPVRLQAVL